MSKIVNEQMKGKQLVTSAGKFEFDANGMAEIPDEFAKDLLDLGGYQLADGETLSNENIAENGEKNAENGEENSVEGEDPTEENGEENDVESDEAEDAEPQAEKSAITMEYLETKNVAQLKKIAKDRNIDLNGAAKKDEIIPIIFGAINQ